VLRSIRRNTLLPALLGWATVSGYDADLLAYFYPDIWPIFSSALTTVGCVGAFRIAWIHASFLAQQWDQTPVEEGEAHTLAAVDEQQLRKFTILLVVEG
jgi:hypothetical protein